LNEGGQSAAGAAIEHLLKLHPFHGEAMRLAAADGVSLPDWLGRTAVSELAGRPLGDLVERVRSLHVVPEFLGNRAPYADPQARAVISGLGMETGLSSLVTLYLAGLCGIGYGLRQIIEVQAAHGAEIARVVVSGGAGRSAMTRQLLADASGKPVATITGEEPVLLGSAILGAVASDSFDDIASAMKAMTRLSEIVEPSGGEHRASHDARFVAFEKLQALAREIRTA
jgi:D-ribulokinase